MRKILEILTPENVLVEFELAGLGSRLVALFLDTLIQFGIMGLILLGMLIGGTDFNNFKNSNYMIVAGGIILLFIVFYGYYIFFELIMNGQTPGKKAMKLRTLKHNGEPIGVFESVLRNILRIADFLPALNFAGAAMILFSKHNKRIGDFAANTIVIKVRYDIEPVTLDSLLHSKENLGEDEINVYPVNNFEYGVLKEFLLRIGKLGNRDKVFVYHLNKYFLKKFNLETPVFENPYDFFKEIVRLNSGV